jgi:hypothetical protein
MGQNDRCRFCGAPVKSATGFGGTIHDQALGALRVSVNEAFAVHEAAARARKLGLHSWPYRNLHQAETG